VIAMTTVTKRAPPEASGDTTKQGPARKIRHFLGKVGHFLLHFVEMCLLMCGVGAILNLAFFGATALIGYPHLRHQFPELSLLVVAFNYALPMAAWMWFRGMAWRPNFEMAGATLGLAIVLIGMTWLGIVSTSTLIALQFSFCGLACLVMLVVMLFRLDLYTGRMGHHAHAT
jgi:hypothetical protein